MADELETAFEMEVPGTVSGAACKTEVAGEISEEDSETGAADETFDEVRESEATGAASDEAYETEAAGEISEAACESEAAGAASEVACGVEAVGADSEEDRELGAMGETSEAVLGAEAGEAVRGAEAGEAAETNAPKGENAEEPEGNATGGAGPEGEVALWKQRAEAYAARVVFSEARAAASRLGVPETRLDPVAKLADTSGIDPEEPDARGRIAWAVQAVLKELPEFAGGAGTGTVAAIRRPRRDAFERGFLGE